MPVEDNAGGHEHNRPDSQVHEFMYSYGLEEWNSWQQREALFKRASSLLADKPDSAEAQCLRIFQLGETMLAMRVQVAEAEKHNDWKTASAAAERGVDAYNELQKKYPLYYQASGDRRRSPHWAMVRYLPYYLAAGAYEPPSVREPKNDKPMLLVDTHLATEKHPDSNVAGASVELADGWNITIDLKAEYDVTQVEISVGVKKPGTPLFVHISWSQEWQDEKFRTVDRIYLRGKDGGDELYPSRLFSVRARYVRLHVRIKEGMFGVGQVRIWGHPPEE